MQETLCAVCGKKQKIKILYRENFDPQKINEEIFSARRVPDGSHYRIVKCLRCGLIFSNPIFNEKKIAALYKKSEFKYEVESLYLKKTYGHYLRKIIKGKNIQDIKLLEIGCGNGFFLEEAKRLGVKNVFGIEPGKASVDKADPSIKKNIIVDILRQGLFKNETFDIICCFHTLDHIVDPNTFLQITYNLLKKGGSAFFIVHDTDGMSVKVFGEKSPIFDIEHIYLFNNRTLTRVFKINKFRTHKIFEIYNTYSLGYWLKLFPSPLFFKKILQTILALIKLDKIPITLNVGNMAIIAYK